MTATLALARFAAELDFSKLPPSLQQKLGELLLDYCRVASLGERLPWSAWARQYTLQTAGPGAAPVLFSDKLMDPVSATFLNAVYAGSIDADDVHVGAMLHPGCIVFSAALAIGSSRKKSGAAVMSAVAAGYEAMIRIALAIQPSHFKRGFQSTSTCGVFGAAVAAAKLLFEGPQQGSRIAESIGIAASFSGGLTQFYHSKTTVKRLHAAQAASSGVRAALLVEAGFSGPVDILEGQDGFARAYADTADLSVITQDLGQKFHAEEVAVKPHACSARVQSAVEAAAGLCVQHGIAPTDIRTITLGIPRVIQGRLTATQPKDLQAAQMSAPFSLALAICRGLASGFSLGITDFETGLKEPLVNHLSGLVDCVVDEQVEQTSTSESVSARVTLGLSSGAVYSSLVLAPLGSASRPYSFEDHLSRTRNELRRRYETQKADSVLEGSQRICALHDVGNFSRLLT